MDHKLLLVDDNKDLRNVLERVLKKRGYKVETAASGDDALRKIKNNHYTILVTDLRMPGKDGMELLKESRNISPSTMVIMITAFGTVESAVVAMKQGAYDYILKPFSPDELEIKIKSALQQQENKLEEISFEIASEAKNRFGRIIGNSKTMRKVYDRIHKVAPTNAPVLITGESGTGKELVAREIHSRSNRAGGPFVAVNCVALASGVLESELFGHEKGSFTGATSRRIGKFESAQNGTLFLDEIGELDEKIQVQLLRFLQEKNFHRVGGNQNIQLDVRILAATNRNLSERIEKGFFREDLFYRLNMFSLHLPALREREDDITELTHFFLSKYNKELGKNVKITSEALALLRHHIWPGNVRELENVVAQGIILAENDALLPKHLPVGLTGEMAEISIEEEGHNQSGISSQINAIESEVIRKALLEENWNQSKTAKKLGLKRTSLQYKMKKYGLSKD